MLSENHRRLQTSKSLGTLSDALDVAVVADVAAPAAATEAVLRAFLSVFSRQRRSRNPLIIHLVLKGNNSVVLRQL